MLPIASTPEFHAVFAADLDAMHGRAAEALEALCHTPGDESAQRILHNALHGLKGLAGIAGSRPIEESVALLDRLATAGASAARDGNDARARALFSFCQSASYELRALCTDTAEGRRSDAHAAAERLREAAMHAWSELFQNEAGDGENQERNGEAPGDGVPLSGRNERWPQAAHPATRSAGAEPDVLGFLQGLGVESPTTHPSASAGGEFPSVSSTEAPREAAAVLRELQSQPPESSSTVDAEMLQYFIPETEEYCEEMEASLAAWERTLVADEPRLTLLRLFHTIKGAANSIGLSALGALAHTLEEVVEAGRKEDDQTDGADKPPALPDATQRRLASASVEVIRVFLRHAAESKGTEMPPRALELLEDIRCARVEAAQLAIAQDDEASKESPEPMASAHPARPDVSEPAASPVQADSTAEEVAFESPGARIDSATLDHLMDLVGELSVSRNRLLAKVESFSQTNRELESCKDRLLKLVSDFQDRHEYSVNRSRGNGAATGPGNGTNAGVRLTGFGDLEFDQYDEFNILARQLVEVGTDTSEIIDQTRRFFSSITEETDKFRKTGSHLQEAITQVRMVPLAPLLRRLRRVALEATGKENKSIEFVTDGGDTRLDKVIAEGVFLPLLHLVRNAVCHGIEKPEQREAAGKPGTGRLVVRAAQRHNQAVIELEDDGAGLDFEAIRRRAVRTGLLSAERAEKWEESRLTTLIFQPGFSTRETAGDVAGRGIGLDAVLQQVARLGGIIEIVSRTGRGCTFTLKLPLTLAIGQAMFVTAGGQRFALPLNFVDRLVSWRPNDLSQDAGGREFLDVPDSDEPVPFLRLDALLGLPREIQRPASKGAGEGDADAADTALAVVAKLADKRVALAIDVMLRRAETVTKPLGPLLEQHPFFSGATIDTDGRVVFVLDIPRLGQGYFSRQGVSALIKLAPAEPVEPLAATPLAEAPAVLIVDDSLSVRKVAEKHAVELGYVVETASDGIVALEKLRSRKFALVLTDLEMPRMHGFELLAAIRRNEATQNLPVIVVTSRQADKHRRQAAALGANDYLIKPFSKAQLGERMAACLAATREAAR